MFRQFHSFCILLTVVFVASCAPYQKNGISSTTAKTDDSAISSDIKTQASEVFKKGDYKKASGLYANIVSLNPADQDALFYYAESLRMSGNTDLAIEQYNKILELNQENLSALEGKGLAYLQSGDLDNSLEQFNHIVTKDASLWRTLNAIGVIYSINNKTEEATHYYQMALEVSGNNPSVTNNIALSIAFGGDTAKGIALLKNALSTMQEDNLKKQTLENNLALLYGISGKMDEAEKILRKNMPEPAVYNNLGYYAKLASDKKLAWDYLSKAISSNPVYYEKAENNMQGLEGQQESSSLIEPSASNSGSHEQIKANRGTHKLPLPYLRPSSYDNAMPY